MPNLNIVYKDDDYDPKDHEHFNGFLISASQSAGRPYLVWNY